MCMIYGGKVSGPNSDTYPCWTSRVELPITDSLEKFCAKCGEV